MHVLIFGGNRFIGKDVVRILADWDECDMIYLFNRTGRGHYNSKKVRCLVGDRNVSKDLKQIPWGYVDYVVDMCLYKTDQFDKIKDRVAKKNYIFVSSIASQLDPVLSGFVVKTLTMMIFHRWNDSMDPHQREVNLTSDPITVIDLIKCFEKHSKKKAELFFNSPDSPFDNKRDVFPDSIHTSHITTLDSGVKALVEEYEKTLQI